jgi:prepilin-type N-terminal cleavage/methylation domain-containing protein
MTRHPTIRRRGMTVLELMVVVMILGLLAVVVLPSLTESIDSRRYREVARSVASFIARAQVRALDAGEPKGFMIQPLEGDPQAAIELFLASTPSAYCGESVASWVTIEDVGANANVSQLRLEFDPLSRSRIDAGDGFVQRGDAIRFGTAGPDYCLLPQGPAVRMWAEDGQTSGNTPWPRGIQVPFRILRQPKRASTGVLQLQRGAAIDIAWSCIGTRPLADPRVPVSQRIVQDISRPISLLFDASGKPRQLVHSGGIRTVVGEPLFLLIGSSEIAGNAPVTGVTGEIPEDSESDSGGANWQYSDAVWLALDNNTGAVKFGPAAGRSATVIESQRFVRMTIALGTAER